MVGWYPALLGHHYLALEYGDLALEELFKHRRQSKDGCLLWTVSAMHKIIFGQHEQAACSGCLQYLLAGRDEHMARHKNDRPPRLPVIPPDRPK
jgi:hypothetical protein